MDSILNIKKLWIDRDTYQKTFNYLSSSLKKPFHSGQGEPAVIFEARLNKESSSPRLTRLHTKLINYTKKEKEESETYAKNNSNNFSVSGSFARLPSPSGNLLAGGTPSPSLNVISFKAIRVNLIDRSSGRVIDQKKFPSNMFIETLLENGEHSKSVELPEVPIVGSFVIPKNYEPNKLQIEVEGLVKEELEDENVIEQNGVHLGYEYISLEE